MAGRGVDEVFGWLAGVDHEAVLGVWLKVCAKFGGGGGVAEGKGRRGGVYSEFHAFRSRGSQFPRDHDLTSLGARFHDEAQDAVAGSPHGEAVEEFVAEGLALGDGAEAAVLDFGGIQGDGVFGEFEAFLDQGGEFPDAATLLAEHFLGVCCADDCEVVSVGGFLGAEGYEVREAGEVPGEGGYTDISHCGRHSDFHARVSLFSQLALEELVQFGVEDAICDELSSFGDGGAGVGRHLRG